MGISLVIFFDFSVDFIMTIYKKAITNYLVIYFYIISQMLAAKCEICGEQAVCEDCHMKIPFLGTGAFMQWKDVSPATRE